MRLPLIRIGRTGLIGNWRIQIGRLYIGLWLEEVGEWKWLHRGIGNYWLVSGNIFGVVQEIRWYDKGKEPHPRAWHYHPPRRK